MFEPKDRIAIAISGGKDSLCLSAILAKIEENFAQSELIGLTIDEGIGQYRKEAVGIASKFCRKIGIEHVVRSFEDLFGYGLDEIVGLKRTSLAPCTYCGVLRRKALNVVAREVGASKLATAHNLDDIAQTFLLNVVHGNVDKIPHLGPLIKIDHPKFVPRVKPFYELQEAELSLYAYLRSVPLQRSTCPYISASLRNDVRNLINRLETMHPGTKSTIFHSFRRIQRSLPVSGALFRDCGVCGEPTPRDICRACSLLSNP